VARYRRELGLVLGVCAVSVTLCACGGSGGSSGGGPPSSPTPVAPGIITLFDTLNPPNSRENLSLRLASHPNYPGSENFSFYVEDFRTAVNAEVRTIKWQGAYCDARFNEVGPPRAVATLFRITIYSDRDNYPAMDFLSVPIGPSHNATYDISQVNEQLDFELGYQPTLGCSNRGASTFTFYSYAAALTTPFAVTANTRYWLRIQPTLSTRDMWWAWRTGRPDNSFGLAPWLGPGTFFPSDAAVSLEGVGR
jgi:hypothetical protein